MTERVRRLRGATAIAALAGALLLTAACSGDSGSAGKATVAPATSAATPTDSSPGNGPATDGDATALVADALSALGSEYHFVTSVKVGDSVVLTAQGDRVGDGARLSLTSDAGVVSYVIVGKESWAKPENGVWAALEAAPSTTDPISALARASAATVVRVEGDTTTVELAVPSADLGIGAEGSSTVTVQIVGGRLVFAVYGTSIDDRAAVVSTEFTTVVDPSAVTAPADAGA